MSDTPYNKPIASRDSLLDIITAANRPLSYADIAKRTELHSEEEREALRRRLNAMVRDEQLQRFGPHNVGLPPVKKLITGTVHAHPDGFGFLVSPDLERSGYLAKEEMDTLLHGDQVEAYSIRNALGRQEWRISRVIQGPQHIIGHISQDEEGPFLTPLNTLIDHDFSLDIDNAFPGELVVASILSRPTQDAIPHARVMTRLGGIDSIAAISVAFALEGGLDPVTPDDIEHEAKQLQPLTEFSNRVDLRDLPLVTIDGEDSRDLDDAVFSEQHADGSYRLVVAIADVSHYVQPGSILDHYAAERATSVYFPNRVIPMLPERLSNDLCSLNEQIDRPTLFCDLHVSHTGELMEYTFAQGVMRSAHRLSYQSANAIMQGIPTAEITPAAKGSLMALKSLLSLRLAVRHARGGLNLDRQEAKFHFDNDRFSHISFPERNDAHLAIEEAMVLANVAAARLLKENPYGGLYRHHGGPVGRKADQLKSAMARQNVILQDEHLQTPMALKEAIASSFFNPEQANLTNTLILRSMSAARYTSEASSHFGLALDDYAHFTSPIRRYPDLIVHRVIKQILRDAGTPVSGNACYSATELEAIGRHCGERDRAATQATRMMEAHLFCLNARPHVGRNVDVELSAVTSAGCFFRLPTLGGEAMVSPRECDDVDNQTMILDDGKILTIGARAQLALAEVDIMLRQSRLSRGPNKQEDQGLATVT